MREINFRAWIKADNRMEYCIGVNPFHVTDCDRLIWKNDEVELMQYTGLKDKNGKKIYEGDILDFFLNDYSCWGNEGMHMGFVEFNDGSCVINYEGNNDDSLHALISYVGVDDVEVIGNIYENKALLIQQA